MNDERFSPSGTEYPDQRDARRYRWLREHGAWDTESFLNSLTPEEYDAELDKRMALDGHSGNK